MKLSQEKLNEYIELYLNDLHDYGDDKSYIVLAESTLKSVKKLITEHKHDKIDGMVLLEDLAKTHKNKIIFEDLRNYIDAANN
jgi:uncharacterized protein YueI